MCGLQESGYIMEVVERQGLEQALFSWSSWDEVSSTTLQFYNVELKVAIGNFPIGKKFECAVMSFEHSYVQLYEDEFAYTFELEVKVGALLKECNILAPLV